MRAQPFPEHNLIVYVGRRAQACPRALRQKIVGNDHGVDRLQHIAAPNTAPDAEVPASGGLDLANIGDEVFGTGHFQHRKRCGLRHFAPHNWPPALVCNSKPHERNNATEKTRFHKGLDKFGGRT